jgi:hypothetical protein
MRYIKNNIPYPLRNHVSFVLKSYWLEGLPVAKIGPYKILEKGKHMSKFQYYTGLT